MNAIIYSNRCIYGIADADHKAAMAFHTHALLSTHEGSYYSGYSKITYNAVLVELAEISEILRKSIKQLFNIKHNLRWNYIYGSVGI